MTPSLNALPIRLAGTGLANNVGAKRFFSPDINYLHEMSWISQVARWIQANEVTHREIWDNYIPSDLEASDRAKLQVYCDSLIDWQYSVGSFIGLPKVPEGETKSALSLACQGRDIRWRCVTFCLWERRLVATSQIACSACPSSRCSVILLGLPAKFGELGTVVGGLPCGAELYLLDIEDGVPVMSSDGESTRRFAKFDLI